MSDRGANRQAFLASVGWSKAKLQSFPGDASSRRYFRLTKSDEVAVLMDAPKAAETPAEPEGATVAERKALGYNAVARLAGPEPAAFLSIANELLIRGFSAPKILAADLDPGFILLEDFGQDVYAKVIEANPEMEAPLYRAAVECLAEIYRSSFPKTMSFKSSSWRVREYDALALLSETHLFLDWYAKDKGFDIPEQGRAEWDQIWLRHFKVLQSHAPGLALRDFHAENLFWLPERESVAKVGLIDFQDGLFVHPAYDLVSFLEDARRDVSCDLVDPLISQFCAQAKLTDEGGFRKAYAVLGAQRNAKILGIFVRLAERDGKPAYRTLIPRVMAHFQKNISGEEFSDLRSWFETYLPGERM